MLVDIEKKIKNIADKHNNNTFDIKGFDTAPDDDVYENIIRIAVVIGIEVISEAGKIPVTFRNENKTYQSKAISDSQILGLLTFVGLLQIFMLQNLKDLDKSRIAKDNLRVIKGIFFLEDLTKSKENMDLIDLGTKQPGVMIKHEDKDLKKIISSLKLITYKYLDNEGEIHKELKQQFPSYKKLFHFYFNTFSRMFEKSS